MNSITRIINTKQIRFLMEGVFIKEQIPCIQYRNGLVAYTYRSVKYMKDKLNMEQLNES